MLFVERKARSQANLLWLHHLLSPYGLLERSVVGLTDLRFCCAANVVTASEVREPDTCRDKCNRADHQGCAAGQAAARRLNPQSQPIGVKRPIRLSDPDGITSHWATPPLNPGCGF